jgi:hypothetical protein
MEFINDNITKGIIFAGCSFTWGQGLYYYSNLFTLKEPPPDAYNPALLTDAHKRYGATLRYPRLVANHFNTFEVVSKQNGGSEDTSIVYLQRCFGIQTAHTHLIDDFFSYDEIEYIVLQTSQIVRNQFQFEHKGRKWVFLPWEEEESKMFYEWLLENNILFEEWELMHYTNVFNKLKSELQFYESKGIKVLLLCWENDYLKFFGDDDWFMDRFIPIEYNNVQYNTIRNLMNENIELHINSDYEYFIETPKDHHPSKKCHEIIANNIINRINKDKNKKIIINDRKIV